MNRFSIHEFHCYSERDYFATGCDPDTGRTWSEDAEFSADDLPSLLKVIAEGLGVPASSLELNACDERGRLDIQCTENGAGLVASPEEIERWKRNEEALWLVTYTAFVMETVDLKGVVL